MRKIHPAIRFLCIVLAFALVCMGAMEFFGLVSSLPRRLLSQISIPSDPAEASGSAPTGQIIDLADNADVPPGAIS